MLFTRVNPNRKFTIKKIYMSNSTDWLTKSMCDLDWNQEEGKLRLQLAL
jgi:hypothetical protein